MNFQAIEAAALVVRANATLEGLLSAAEFERSCTRDHRVEFVSGRLLKRLQSPTEWLCTQVVRSVRLGADLTPRRGLPVWYGEAQWLIEQQSDGGTTVWTSSTAFDESRRGDRPWSITYARVAKPDRLPDDPSLDAVYAEVVDAYSAISQFARRNNLGYADLFEAALNRLTWGDSPEGEWLESGILEPLARRLFVCAVSGNYFTGMGNWGDNFYGDNLQPEVNRQTERLFRALAHALIASSNSSAQGRSATR